MKSHSLIFVFVTLSALSITLSYSAQVTINKTYSDVHCTNESNPCSFMTPLLWSINEIPNDDDTVTIDADAKIILSGLARVQHMVIKRAAKLILNLNAVLQISGVFMVRNMSTLEVRPTANVLMTLNPPISYQVPIVFGENANLILSGNITGDVRMDNTSALRLSFDDQQTAVITGETWLSPTASVVAGGWDKAVDDRASLSVGGNLHLDGFLNFTVSSQQLYEDVRREPNNRILLITVGGDVLGDFTPTGITTLTSIEYNNHSITVHADEELPVKTGFLLALLGAAIVYAVGLCTVNFVINKGL